MPDCTDNISAGTQVVSLVDRRGIYLAPADLQWSLFGAPEQFKDNASQSC